MNILVTGANGQLGNCLRDISSAMNGMHFFFSDITEQEGVQTLILDITDADAVNAAVRQYNIDVIVNCAAYTNVDAAEDNRDTAYLLNATAPGILANAMTNNNGILVHISTDYIFGKEMYNTPCGEDMTGTPTGVYGETKLAGEQKIIASGCNYVIIRTAWLYSIYGKNFVKTMLRLTKEKPQLNVVFDQVGTPTYAPDLAQVILSILSSLASTPSVHEIYNYTNEGVCSWYDFAKAVADLSGHTACTILPCHSSEFPSKVIRPAYSVLDKTKIKCAFDITIPHWIDSLKECISLME